MIGPSNALHVAGGIDATHPHAVAFATHLALRRFHAVFPTQIIGRSLYHENAELEYKAAVDYILCLKSGVHLGTLASSFDMLLHVKRTLQRGPRDGDHSRVPSGVNLHGKSAVDPELRKIFSSEMFP